VRVLCKKSDLLVNLNCGRTNWSKVVSYCFISKYRPVGNYDVLWHRMCSVIFIVFLQKGDDNMSNRRLDVVIYLSELPSRPRKLDPEEMRDIFGGCYTENKVCIVQSDCCAGLICGTNRQTGPGLLGGHGWCLK